VVIKSLKFIILVKSVIIVYTVNLQYIPVVRVIDVNYRYCSYKVQNRGSNALFPLFLYLPLGLLFLLNLFLKLK